ncbi:helix-turn-helix domain-containing protein [Levilactobacillus fujinensis]|uniref:Helix-turn-helix domain-containing protein n=1 Tax=Levilactobacillus fujinensis TaxID=2486024 RepID=A0ABW1TFK4_9LACO|nr:helix-turn-helix domain-containing protein [Levilactobacillus fujinensis]
MEAMDLLQVLDHQQPRRLRVIENLLRGRRTVSTLYWGQRYHLLPLLDADKHLDRGALTVPAQQLVAANLVTLDSEEDQLLLTPAGQQRQSQVATYYRPQTSGDWLSLDLGAVRQRTLLAVQVTSQYAHSTSRYYPLTTDLATRRIIRQWFHRLKGPQLAETLSVALIQSLQQLPVQTAEAMTDLLTGYQHPGLTVDQVASKQQQTAWEIRLRQRDGLTQIARDARRADHPFHSLLQSLWRSPVTRSAQATLYAVEQGGSLEQVAAQRHVKTNTVKEHLLEAAILSPVAVFPYDQLLPESVRADFATVLNADIDSWQFAQLPEALRARYDFFYFRLYAIWRGRGMMADGTTHN